MEEKNIITSSTPASEAAETTGERIIPITILSARHGHNDVNDNKASMASKRLSMPPLPSNNNLVDSKID